MLTDSELADCIQSGDVGKWDELYRRNMGLVAMLVGRAGGQRSHESRCDICADIWIDVITALQRRLFCSGRAPFGKWLWSVAKNHLFQRTRRPAEIEVESLPPGIVDKWQIPADRLIDYKRSAQSKAGPDEHEDVRHMSNAVTSRYGSDDQSCEVEIPGMRIPSSSNLREHWLARSRRAKQQRQVVHMALSGSVRAGWITKSRGVTITLIRQSPRCLDSDNLVAALKACRDGVADWLARTGHDKDSAITSWRYEQRMGPMALFIRIRLRQEEGNQ